MAWLLDPCENLIGQINVTGVLFTRVNENTRIQSYAAMTAQEAPEAG